VYHITSRGNARQDIFLDDEDRLRFLKVLEDSVTQYHWICHAYCLMPNHYHLLIETPAANLSRGMRQLNGVYTQGFNRRHPRVGHVLQGRYKRGTGSGLAIMHSKLVVYDVLLQDLTPYIYCKT
jgi:REP element-mobilizing transposase RayT